MEEDGDALGSPLVLASKGQGAGSCSDGDTLTRRGGDGATADEAALGTDALQAAMDEDGDALGPPLASASKGRGQGAALTATPSHGTVATVPLPLP
jgi:hypothetical protein